jgi:hypothetical protein
MILTTPTKNLRKRSNTNTAEPYGVTLKTQTRNSESKKARNLETKRPRNQETQKPRDAEAKKPINQETEKPRHASQAPAELYLVLYLKAENRLAPRRRRSRDSRERILSVTVTFLPFNPLVADTLLEARRRGGRSNR